MSLCQNRQDEVIRINEGPTVAVWLKFVHLSLLVDIAEITVVLIVRVTILVALDGAADVL
jgi:hypothetical protein